MPRCSRTGRSLPRRSISSRASRSVQLVSPLIRCSLRSARVSAPITPHRGPSPGGTTGGAGQYRAVALDELRAPALGAPLCAPIPPPRTITSGETTAINATSPSARYASLELPGGLVLELLARHAPARRDRRPRREALEAVAVVGAGARRSRRRRSGDAQVAELRMGEPVDEPAAGDHAGADPGADRDVGERVEPLRRAEAVLADRRRVHVRVERDRHAQPLAKRPGNLRAGPPRLRRRRDPARREVDRPKAADPERRHRALGARRTPPPGRASRPGSSSGTSRSRRALRPRRRRTSTSFPRPRCRRESRLTCRRRRRRTSRPPRSAPASAAPLNGGITPLPFVTRSITSAFGGFASSRFGPTVPVAPASFSVWQLVQPAFSKICLPIARVAAAAAWWWSSPARSWSAAGAARRRRRSWSRPSSHRRPRRRRPRRRRRRRPSRPAPVTSSAGIPGARCCLPSGVVI